MESANPFEQAVNCATKKEPVTSDSNCSCNFMLIRALFELDGLEYVAATANRYANGAPLWATRMFCHFASVARRKYRKRNPAPKAPLKNKKDTPALFLIEKDLKVSSKHAKETYELLQSQGVDLGALYGEKLSK